jgi:teichuronic acid exporter
LTIDEEKSGNLADDHQGFAQRVFRSFVYSGLGNVLGKVVSLLSIVVGAILVGVEAFGAVGLGLGVLAIVRATTEAGLGVALVQAKKASREQFDSLFWASLLITGVGYLVVFFAVAPIFEIVYDDFENIGALVRGMCFSVALYTFYFIPRALMERELHMGRLILIDNISHLIAAGALFWAINADQGALSFVYFELGLRGSQAVLSMLVRPFIPKLRLNFGEIRDMFRFAMFATGSRLLYNFYSNADFFVVGKLFGPWTMGVYHAAWRIISEPVKGLAMAMNQVAYPAFARLQDDRERLRAYFFTINRISMAVIGSVLGVIVIFSGPLLAAFEDVIEPKWMGAIPLVWLFSPMGLFKTITPLVAQLLNAVGQARLSFLYSLACALLLPIFFVIGGLVYDVEGVALAWVLGYPLVLAVLYYFAALVLELPMVKLLKVFAGLRIALPVFALQLGIFYLLSTVLDVGHGLTALIGMPLSLILSGLIVYAFERSNLAKLKPSKKAEPANPEVA